MTKDTIGCDISKDWIDAFRLSDRTYVKVPNNGAGYEDLFAWFGQEALARVVYEPTGAYHRAFEEALAGRAPLCKVNPLHARRFAQASGVRAKTDKVDAQVLARMGIALQLEPDPIVGGDTHLLNELQTVRRALIKDRGRARNQLGTQREALSRRLTTARLKLIETQIAEVDTAIRARLLSCPRRSQALACIESIKGIGTVVAQAILTDMPEIGTLSAKAAASLAGLAPITRQSGKWKGRSAIGGGRKHLRDALYMPALVASRHNPDMRALYTRMVEAGKPAKVALTAIMRKLIILANTLVKENRVWTPN